MDKNNLRRRMIVKQMLPQKKKNNTVQTSLEKTRKIQQQEFKKKPTKAHKGSKYDGSPIQARGVGRPHDGMAFVPVGPTGGGIGNDPASIG